MSLGHGKVSEVLMCSEYTTKTSPKAVEKALGVPLLNWAENFEWGKTVKLYTQAPIIQRNGNRYELSEKVFPSSPMPNARLSGIGNQSDGNDSEEDEHTQIRRIYEMPRWKDAFENRPLIVPMSSFTEFAYWGDSAGTAQDFTISNEEVLFAAGIEIKPFTPKGEKSDGFAILTHTATDQMLKYHQRLIVLLKPEDAITYLDVMSSKERFDFLIEKRYTSDLHVEKLRNMAKGWEKRIPVQTSKLEREHKYREVLRKEAVAG